MKICINDHEDINQLEEEHINRKHAKELFIITEHRSGKFDGFMTWNYHVVVLPNGEYMATIREPTVNELPQLRELLLKHGDIPSYEVDIALSKGNWLVAVENGKILSAGRFEKTDWYETTLKNLVTHPDARKRGFGSTITKMLYKRAKKESPGVFKADITSTNVASQGTMMKLGFKPVKPFDWSSTEPSADIWMKVEKKPSREKLKRQKRFTEKQIYAYHQRTSPLQTTPTESVIPSHYLSPKLKKKKSKQSQLDIEQTKQTSLW